MEVALERFLCINCAMDWLLYLLVARSVGHVSHKRVFLAALLGTLSAFLSAWLSFPWGCSLALQGVSTAFGVALAVRPTSFAAWAKAWSLLWICTAFFGGVHLLFGGGMFAWCAATLAATLASACLLRVRSRRIPQCEIRIALWEGVCRTEFTAFVDTGNRLCEPISALPVLIVSQAVLPKNFGQSLCRRRVYFDALGGGGILPCFRPDAADIDLGDGIRPCPDIWVAVYPGTMPDGIHALAPACIALS